MHKKMVTCRNAIMLISALGLFSGCIDFSPKKTNETSGASQSLSESEVQTASDGVLLSVNGKPAITKEQFETHVDRIVQANPQIREVLQAIPSMKYNIFSGMIGEEVLKAWAQEKNITETEEYKRDYELAQKMIQHELARKFFQEDLAKNTKVSASEIKKYYEDNKDTVPDLLVSPGGIKAYGVAFDTSAKSAAFAQKAKAPGVDFKKLVKAEKLELKDFDLVNEYSVDVDKTIKKQLLDAGAIPGLVYAKTEDGKYWTMYAESKNDPEYRALEQVQEGIERMLISEKMKVVYSEKIAELKVAYKVEEHKGYFNTQSMQELLAQAEEEQPEQQSERKPTHTVA